MFAFFFFFTKDPKSTNRITSHRPITTHFNTIYNNRHASAHSVPPAKKMVYPTREQSVPPWVVLWTCVKYTGDWCKILSAIVSGEYWKWHINIAEEKAWQFPNVFNVPLHFNWKEYLIFWEVAVKCTVVSNRLYKNCFNSWSSVHARGTFKLGPMHWEEVGWGKAAIVILLSGI